MKQKLRQLLNNEQPVIAPGAYDALTSLLVERAGFPAIYATGAGASAALLGRPDLGMLSLYELTENTKRMTSAVNIPVIADMDTGFGNAISVMRTVTECERAGLAAIHIEDQVWPKKCGFLQGTKAIPAEEMVNKLAAALDARTDPDFVIIARVEAKAVGDFDEVIERAHRYAETGVDMVFVNGVTSMEEVERVSSELASLSQVYNVSTSGRTPLLPIEQIAKLGFKLIIYPAYAQLAVCHAVDGLLQTLKTTGSITGFKPHMISFEQWNELLGLDRYYELEEKYSS